MLILDEVQKIPDWSEEVKKLWDEEVSKGGGLHVCLGTERVHWLSCRMAHVESVPSKTIYLFNIYDTSCKRKSVYASSETNLIVYPDVAVISAVLSANSFGMDPFCLTFAPENF